MIFPTSLFPEYGNTKNYGCTCKNKPAPQSPSLKDVCREFMLKTSLHGCSHVIDHRCRRVVRYLWMLLIIGMGVCLGWALLELFLRYRTYPFSTAWSVRQTPNVILPAITLCLPAKVDMLRTKQVPHIYGQILDAKQFFKPRTSSNSSEDKARFLLKARELMREMSSSTFHQLTRYDYDDVFIYEKYDVQDWKENNGDSRLQSIYDKDKSCWIFNGGKDGVQDRRMTRFDSIFMIVDVNSHRFPPDVIHKGLEIRVHDSHQDPLLQKVYFLKPGSYAQIFFKRVEHRYLNLPYGSFENIGCIDEEGPDFQNPLKMWPKYSQGSCIMEKMLNEVTKNCSCTLPEHARFFPNFSECSALMAEECFNQGTKVFLKRTLMRDGPHKIGCLHECKFATYDITLSSASFPTDQTVSFFYAIGISKDLKYSEQNLLSLNIEYTDESVQIIEHIPEMTYLTIFGTIGGYLGLFLGASLLTLTELLETFIYVCYLLFCQIKNKFNVRVGLSR